VLKGDHPDSSGVFQALFFLNLDQLAGVRDARPAWSKLEEQRFESILEDYGDRGEKDGAGPNPLAKNPPLYYALGVVPYYVGSAGSFWDRLVVMRLFSGALFLLTVLFTWLVAAELFRTTWPRVIATACVALLPQMTALSGLVNADNLLITIWTAFAYAGLRLVRHGPSVRRTLALCGLAGASLLTHGRGTAILLPLAVVLLIAYLRPRPRFRDAARTLAPGLALLFAVLVAYRLWLAPEGGAYGGEVNLGQTPGAKFSVAQLLNTTWQFYFPHLPFTAPRLGPAYGYRQVMIESFFGRFASLEVGYPSAVYSLIQAACAVGLAGLVAAVLTRWSAVRARWAEIAVPASMTIGMLGLLHAASYRALINSGDPLITGRYLLPLIVVFGATVAFVVDSARRRVSVVLGGLVIGGLLALNVAGLMLTLTRFYG
jgi:4-amino-4-deoxy-L-arabinose transferase-like glycosyltransferase